MATLDAQPSLKWPPLNIRRSNAETDVIWLFPEQIVTIPNFWSEKLCRTYISFLSTLPLTTTPGKPRRGDAIRVNDRFQIQDAQFAKELWVGSGLEDLLLGDNSPFASYQGGAGEAGSRLWGGEVVSVPPSKEDTIPHVGAERPSR